jgi:hypothetical protein
MPIKLEQLTYVVDENLLRFGKALVGLRNDLACFGQPPLIELLPPGIGDTEWIPVVGQRGWIAITNDKRLRTRPAEATLAFEHRLKVIHLHGSAGYSSAFDQTVRFMTRWSTIKKHVDTNPDGPWWLSVQQTMTRAMSFAPGAPDRG